MAQTGGEYLMLAPGKKLPDSISHWRMIKNSGVVPMIGAALSNPSYCAGASPITRGAMRLILSI